MLKSAGAQLEFLKQESSVADFSTVEARLTGEDAHEASEKLEGACQREFERFLAEKDAKHNWGGLSRVTLDEGVSVW